MKWPEILSWRVVGLAVAISSLFLIYAHGHSPDEFRTFPACLLVPQLIMASLAQELVRSRHSPTVFALLAFLLALLPGLLYGRTIVAVVNFLKPKRTTK